MTENNWIEIISVRLSNPAYRQAVLNVFDQVNSRMKETLDIGSRVEMYNNTTNETDWSIYLHWKKQGGDLPKTMTGMSIADTFRSLGLVNHSIWKKNS